LHKKLKGAALMKIDLDAATSVCNACYEIGLKLENERIMSVSRDAKAGLDRSGKLRVAFIADNANILNLITQEVFHFPALPKGVGAGGTRRPAVLCYSKGEEDVYADFSGLEENGEEILLSSQVHADILESFDVELYLKDGGFDGFDWKKELPKADYVFLAVSAIQMLTSAERNFIQEQIREYFGLARFAVVITNTDKLPSLKALEDMEERLAWYLDSLGGGIVPYELGTGTLESFVTETLLCQSDELRQMAYWQSSSRCCSQVQEELDKMLCQSTVDLEELKKQIEVLKSREKDMKRRGDTLANSIYNAFSGRIAYNAVIASRKFIDQMDENICNNLDQSDDLKSTVELLPGFIESAVSQLEQELSREMSSDGESIMDEMSIQMEKDAGEFFTGVPDWAIDMIDMIIDGGGMIEPPMKHNLEGLVEEAFEKASVRKMQRISKLLLVGTLPALILVGAPLAVGTLAASQIVKKIKFKSADIDIKDLKSKVHEYCRELAIYIEECIKGFCERQAEDASRMISNAYESFVSRILDVLSSKAASAQQSQEKSDMLRDIMERELPAIKKNLN